jgi:hypothetical protein
MTVYKARNKYLPAPSITFSDPVVWFASGPKGDPFPFVDTEYPLRTSQLDIDQVGSFDDQIRFLFSKGDSRKVFHSFRTERFDHVPVTPFLVGPTQSCPKPVLEKID